MEKARVKQAVDVAEEVLLEIIGRINKESGANGGFATAHDTKGEFIIAVATLASGILAAE